MGKRDEARKKVELLISKAEIALQDINNPSCTGIKSVFSDFSFNIDFNDEQPKIMSAEEILEKHGTKTGYLTQHGQRVMVEKAIEETIKRCAKLCDDSDKNVHPSDLADSIRSLIIK